MLHISDESSQPEFYEIMFIQLYENNKKNSLIITSLLRLFSQCVTWQWRQYEKDSNNDDLLVISR